MPFHRGTLMISGVMMWKSKSRDCRNLMWLQRRNLPCPRFPLRGLPEGWTMEQWRWYGQKYLEDNEGSAS